MSMMPLLVLPSGTRKIALNINHLVHVKECEYNDGTLITMCPGSKLQYNYTVDLAFDDVMKLLEEFNKGGTDGRLEQLQFYRATD